MVLQVLIEIVLCMFHFIALCLYSYLDRVWTL